MPWSIVIIDGRAVPIHITPADTLREYLLFLSVALDLTAGGAPEPSLCVIDAEGVRWLEGEPTPALTARLAVTWRDYSEITSQAAA